MLATCTLACTAILDPTPTPLAFARRSTPPPSRTAVPSAVATAGSADIFDEAAVQAIAQQIDDALAAGEPARLEVLMLDRIDLFKGDELERTLSRSEAIRWLQERLGTLPRVEHIEQTPHFALLSIVTGPWARPGAEPFQVQFKLHRYDAGGRQSAYTGDWRIDGLGY